MKLVGLTLRLRCSHEGGTRFEGIFLLGKASSCLRRFRNRIHSILGFRSFNQYGGKLLVCQSFGLKDFSYRISFLPPRSWYQSTTHHDRAHVLFLYPQQTTCFAGWGDQNYWPHLFPKSPLQSMAELLFFRSFRNIRMVNLGRYPWWLLDLWLQAQSRLVGWLGYISGGYIALWARFGCLFSQESIAKPTNSF